MACSSGRCELAETRGTFRMDLGKATDRILKLKLL